MLWFFELIIWLFLFVDLAVIILSILYYYRGNFRIKKLFRFSLYLAFLIFLWGVIFYGSFIEPWRIKINQEEITLSQYQNKNLKVAFIADLHLGYYKNDGLIKKIVKKLQAENPDLIFLGGDYILRAEENGRFLEGLGIITRQIPTFAVWGNHEYNVGANNDLSSFKDKRATAKATLKGINVHILENESRLVETDKGKFWLIGVDDLWAQKTDLKKALQGTNNAYPKILLSHHPDIINQAQAQGIDLVLSGHTHGGQIRLPLIGSISYLKSTELDRQYDRGLFNFGLTRFFVTTGLGEAGPRARLFCRPEIVILDLQF